MKQIEQCLSKEAEQPENASIKSKHMLQNQLPSGILDSGSEIKPQPCTLYELAVIRLVISTNELYLISH
jgi:hypothetical protein